MERPALLIRMDSAEIGEHFVGHLLDRVHLGQVAGVYVCGAALSADLVGDLLELLGSARDECNVTTGGGDLLRGRLADARRAACDHDVLAVDGVAQRASLDRINEVLQVERPVSTGGVRCVQKAGHRGDGLLDETYEITEVHGCS
jgi:hypothetical protein